MNQPASRPRGPGPCTTLGAACLLFACAGLWPAVASAARPAATPAAPAACPALLDQRVPRLQDEKPQHLCQYAGKVLLVVNTASYCGYTSQFKGLEALNARFAARGLVVMGFPSNDFRQEDADAARTADVCFNTWGVQFPMFATGAVRGAGAQPLFRALASATGQAPSWNFNKYLVGRDGRPIAHYGSAVDPGDRALVAAIEQALAAPAPTSGSR
jgi:glutathione peroxidase